MMTLLLCLIGTFVPSPRQIAHVDTFFQLVHEEWLNCATPGMSSPVYCADTVRMSARDVEYCMWSAGICGVALDRGDGVACIYWISNWPRRPRMTFRDRVRWFMQELPPGGRLDFTENGKSYTYWKAK